MSEAPRSSCSVFSPSTHSSATFKSFPTSGSWMQNGFREVRGTAAWLAGVTKCSTGKVNKRQVACGLLGFSSTPSSSTSLLQLLSPETWETPSLADGGFSQASCPCSSRAGSLSQADLAVQAEGGCGWLKALLATSHCILTRPRIDWLWIRELGSQSHTEWEMSKCPGWDSCPCGPSLENLSTKYLPWIS